MRSRAANRVSLRLGGVGDGWERGEVDGDLIVLEIGCMWRSRHIGRLFVQKMERR